MSWNPIERDKIVRATEDDTVRKTEDGRVRICLVRQPITWVEDAVSGSWSAQSASGNWSKA